MTESLLEFPCEVTVKAMGLTSESFAQRVTDIVVAHLASPEEATTRSNISSKAKYLSVSVTFRAENQAHLEAVYADLYDCKDIVFTL